MHRANPDIDFVVCFFHHCAYSTSTKATIMSTNARIRFGRAHQRRSPPTTRSSTPRPTAPSITRSDQPGGRGTTSSPVSRKPIEAKKSPTPSSPTTMSGPHKAASRTRRWAGRGCGIATMRFFGSTCDLGSLSAKWTWSASMNTAANSTNSLSAARFPPPAVGAPATDRLPNRFASIRRG